MVERSITPKKGQGMKGALLRKGQKTIDNLDPLAALSPCEALKVYRDW